MMWNDILTPGKRVVVTGDRDDMGHELPPGTTGTLVSVCEWDSLITIDGDDAGHEFWVGNTDLTIIKPKGAQA